MKMYALYCPKHSLYYSKGYVYNLSTAIFDLINDNGRCDRYLTKEVEKSMTYKRPGHCGKLTSEARDKLINYDPKERWASAHAIKKHEEIKNNIDKVMAEYVEVKEYEFDVDTDADYKFGNKNIKAEIKEITGGRQCACCGMIIAKCYKNNHVGLYLQNSYGSADSAICYPCLERIANKFKSIPKPECYDKMISQQFLHKL